MANFLNLFSPCSAYDGPPVGSNQPRMSPAEKCEAAATAGIKACLAYSPSNRAFLTREVFEGSPELTAKYAHANSLGDLLGRGKNGLGLHPAPGGGHQRCQENANLFILGACCSDFPALRDRMRSGESAEDVLVDAELDEAVLRKLVESLGFDTPDELAHEISQLPSASESPISTQPIS